MNDEDSSSPVSQFDQIEASFFTDLDLLNRDDDDWSKFDMNLESSDLLWSSLAMGDDEAEERNPKKRKLAGVSPVKKVLKIRQNSSENVSTGTSKYRGVIWDQSVNSWRSKLKVGARSWYLGIFQEESEAGKSYDVAAYFLHGQRANLNFPSENYEDVLPKKIPGWLIPFIKRNVEKYPNHASMTAKSFLSRAYKE